MHIPDRIKLGGIPIDVIKDPNLARDHDNMVGNCLYPQQKLLLDTGAMAKESTEQNYLHELVHWILHVMGEPELRDDEAFVDLFARFLHQALTPEEK